MNLKINRTPVQYVQLMGGLGNQLFQIAAGLYWAKDTGRKLVVDDSFGNFRKNYLGTADVLSYNSQVFSTVGNCVNKKSLIRKLFSILVRISFGKKLSSINLTVIKIIRLIISIFLSLKLRKIVKFWSATNLGFEKVPNSNFSQYIFGYFQTYRFASDEQVKDILRNLSISSDVVSHYKQLALLEKPLIVHVRLSDYYLESKFGVLSVNYYESAIAIMIKKFSFRNIWVFSDEIEKAKLIIPKSYLPLCKWIDDKNESSVETLEKMRLGSGYIIGNSTFSWWGAFLSYEVNPPTIAPDPWFIGTEDPKDLIPGEWLLISR